MFIKNNISNFAIFLCLITIYGFQCNDCESIDRNVSYFSLGESLTQDTYQLGDTISIRATFSSTFPLECGGEFDNSNESVSFQFDVLRVLNQNQKIFEGIKYFEILNNRGTFTPKPMINKDFRGDIILDCNDQECEVDISFIPLKKGYFAFASLDGWFLKPYSHSNCFNNITKPNLSKGRDNNFGLCNEIGTTEIVINTNNTRSVVTDVKTRDEYYFFKVVE